MVPCIPGIARSVALFGPTGRLSELFGNFAQKLCCSLFGFRRDFFFHKLLHARDFFVHALPKLFKVVDPLQPREFVINAFAKLFESAHA